MGLALQGLTKKILSLLPELFLQGFFNFCCCYYFCYYYAFILDQEIMSQISEIGEILRNENLPGYLKSSAETAKGIIKFFVDWLFSC